MRAYSLLFMSCIMLSLISPLIISIDLVRAQASSAIDNAINEGINYVLRSIVFLDSSWSKAVMRDHPSIPITIVWNGNRITAGGVLDPGNRDYKGESSVGPNYIYEKYYFNPDHQGDYDVVVEVKVTNIDETTDKVNIAVVKCTLNNVKMIVGSYNPVINTYIYSGWTKTITAPYYYQWRYSARYVARHSTRIAAWLLEEFGYDEYAKALNNFMNSLGFKYDVYAPVFGKDINYPDDFFDKKAETYIPGSSIVLKYCILIRAGCIFSTHLEYLI